LANKIGINLTEKSVSIVNVGNLAFLRYAKIFLRKSEPEMETPVAVITDVDIREYEKNLVIDHEGKPVKNDKEKNTYDYQKIDNTIFSKQTSEAKAALEKNSEKNLTYFIAPSWTFEYSLLKSKSLGTLFKDVVKSIHTGTDWDTNFEKALAAMLINKGLKKTEIAYQMAQKIENDSKEVKEKKKASCSINIDITDVDDTINYLVKAIKHAARN
jgi:putative ATP-dependent endonuclease of OLD family